ncbi:MAG: ankyrin repeat domain-containing protein [Opitutales bacterium]|nr:ankyrin repeat domain-containing protein [Opitutales bacterium]
MNEDMNGGNMNGEEFDEESVPEELLANPPHPRDADPEWYAQNCLGKIKNTQIFIDAAKAILDYGTDVNARANGTDHPALVCAYLWDRPEFEKLLLSYGADKKLALFHICERNDFDLLKKILPRIKSLADVPVDALGNTILHRAVLAGRADMIPEIVKRGVPVNVQNKHADTPLHLAAEKEDEACVVSLLALGANVNAKDKGDRKPFQRFWNVPNPKLSQILKNAQKKN